MDDLQDASAFYVKPNGLVPLRDPCFGCGQIDVITTLVLCCGPVASPRRVVFHLRCLETYCLDGTVDDKHLSPRRISDIFFRSFSVRPPTSHVIRELRHLFSWRTVRAEDVLVRGDRPADSVVVKPTVAGWSCGARGCDRAVGERLVVEFVTDGRLAASVYHRKCLSLCGADGTPDQRRFASKTIQSQFREANRTEPAGELVLRALNDAFLDDARASSDRNDDDRIALRVAVLDAAPRHNACARCHANASTKESCLSFSASLDHTKMWFHDRCVREMTRSEGVSCLHRYLVDHFEREHWTFERLEEVVRLRYHALVETTDPNVRS